jgi:O-antigen/teichoic acid export membrane protein
VAGWVTVVSLQGLLAEIFRGFHDIRLATIFYPNGLLAGGLLMASLVLLWLLGGEASLATVILIAAGSSCTSLLLASWALRRKVKSLPPQNTEPTVRLGEVLQVAWPLLTTNLVLFALAQAGLWIVGAFRPEEEVAIYGAAARTVLLVAVPLVIAEAVVPPLIAEMYAQGRKRELERTLRIVATLTGVPAFLLLIGLALMGGPVLGLIFGSYYVGGAAVLTLLCIGQLSGVWVGCCGHTLMMTGHQGTMMVITIASGTITIITGLWAVGHYGVLGVATTMAAGSVIQSVFMLLATRYKTGIWTHFGIANFTGLMRAIRTPWS